KPPSFVALTKRCPSLPSSGGEHQVTRERRQAMTKRIPRSVVLAAVIFALSPACGVGWATNSSWQQEFAISSCKLQTTGRNDYFVLEPGFQLVLEGGGTKVEITVLDETRTIDGVVTRVVEEREWRKGELLEVARKYLASCEKVKESSANSSGTEYKYHAPGIGLVGDQDLRLVKHGFVKGK